MSNEVHSVLLNLEYSFIAHPGHAHFESNSGLWRDYNEYRIIDNLGALTALADEINRENGSEKGIEKRRDGFCCQIIQPSLNSQMITLSIQGSKDFVNHTRVRFLQAYNQVNYKSISLSDSEFMAIGPSFTDTLLEICRQYRVEAVISGERMMDARAVGTRRKGAWLHVVGPHDNVTLAEPAIRVLMSTVLHGDHLGTVQVDLSIVPLAGGVDLCNFTQIARQTGASIYIPDLMPGLFSSAVMGNTRGLQILITSESAHRVKWACSIVERLVNGVGPLLVKEVDLFRAKLDSMVLYSQSQMLAVMMDHGVFVQFPSLGEDSCKVLVQGRDEESVESAVNAVNAISAQYYVAQVQVQDTPFDKSKLVSLVQLRKTLTITQNDTGLVLTGSAGEVKQALRDLRKEPCSVVLRIELSNSQRDFIAGKKNGKLIKILNQLHQAPQIAFRPFSEYAFFVELSLAASADLTLLLKAVDLLELELPAELRFNIPELFHKTVIGNGGCIIQSVMKKYNVFIKFSSTPAPTDMYTFWRPPNVLIKCPRKNSASIELVKREVDALVAQCAASVQPAFSFRLLKAHYLLMVNTNRVREVAQAEATHGCFVDFPTSIDAFVGHEMLLDVVGPDQKARSCLRQLLALLPSTYEFRLTSSNKFDDHFVMGGAHYEEFQQRVAIPFRVLLGVEVSVGERDQILVCHYGADLTDVIHNLTLYLREKGFLILERNDMKQDENESPRKKESYSSCVDSPYIESPYMESPYMQTYSPYKRAQGSPYKSHQGSPYKGAQGSPYKSHQGSPQKGAQGSPYKIQGQGSPYKGAFSAPFMGYMESPYKGPPPSFMGYMGGYMDRSPQKGYKNLQSPLKTGLPLTPITMNGSPVKSPVKGKRWRPRGGSVNSPAAY